MSADYKQQAKDRRERFEDLAIEIRSIRESIPHCCKKPLQPPRPSASDQREMSWLCGVCGKYYVLQKVWVLPEWRGDKKISGGWLSSGCSGTSGYSGQLDQDSGWINKLIRSLDRPSDFSDGAMCWPSWSAYPLGCCKDCPDRFSGYSGQFPACSGASGYSGCKGFDPTKYNPYPVYDVGGPSGSGCKGFDPTKYNPYPVYDIGGPSGYSGYCPPKPRSIIGKLYDFFVNRGRKVGDE
jgi:hypothetical protein